MSQHIYLDNCATTAVDERVLDAMLPFFTEHYGNPASTNHPFGLSAKEAVDLARGEIANTLHADPAGVLFTSGATEANNLALRGSAQLAPTNRRHVVTVATEHPSVLETCKDLAHQRFDVEILPVDGSGHIDLHRLQEVVTDKTFLVSAMIANHEIGTLHPIQEIGKIARAKGAFFHCDGSQAYGKVPIDFTGTGIDLMSISAHKIHGPKGVGALIQRRENARIAPLSQGGGQEFGFRPGTLNVPGIVGFGKAAALAHEDLPKEAAKLAESRDLLEKVISSNLGDVVFQGDRAPGKRLPHLTSMTLNRVHQEGLMKTVPHLIFSAGAACETHEQKPSPVLLALGLNPHQIFQTVRLAVSRMTTRDEIEIAAEDIVRAVKKIRHWGLDDPAES